MEKRPVTCSHDAQGREIPDSTPMALPVGFRRPLTITELIQRQIRTAISLEAARRGDETFEEADDFDIGDDDPELQSDYELDDEQQKGSIREFIEEQPTQKAKKQKDVTEKPSRPVQGKKKAPPEAKFENEDAPDEEDQTS